MENSNNPNLNSFWNIYKYKNNTINNHCFAVDQLIAGLKQSVKLPPWNSTNNNNPQSNNNPNNRNNIKIIASIIQYIVEGINNQTNHTFSIIYSNPNDDELNTNINNDNDDE